MSPKIQRTSKASMPVCGNTSAIDFAASSDHQGALNTKRKNKHPSLSKNAQPSLNKDSNGSASEEIAADDSGGSHSDDADADNEESSNGDPDVQAPFDMHCAPDEGQAGLYQDSTSITEMETKASAEQILAFESGESSPRSHDIATMSSVLEGVVSDDDDYNGVDLISESGDEEPAVEHLEEKAIIESEEENIGRSLPLSPPNSPSDAPPTFSANLANTDLSVSPWLTEDPFFAEQINLLDRGDFVYDADYYGHASVFESSIGVEDVPRRRVHFAEPLMLPSEDETTGSLSNDMVLSSNQLAVNESDSEGVRLTEGGEGEGVQSSLDNSSAAEAETAHCTSTHPDALSSGNIGSVENDDAESSAGSSSGYETDQGETTDEEDVPASATTRPSALLRHSSSDLNNRLAAQPLPKAPTSKLPPGHRWGPTLGSWVADPTKPIAVVASSGTQLIVYPAQRPSGRGGKVFPTIASSGQSSAHNSPRTSLPRLAAPSYPAATDESEVERSDMSSQGITTPMRSASTNLMMSGLGLGSANLLSGHALGPPEAFFPFQSIGADGNMVLDGPDVDDDDDDDDDDGESLLNIEDFIDFGEDSEDSDREDGNDTESFQTPIVSLSDLTDTDPTPTVSPITPASNHNLLGHLDNGLVTAFRRNQYDHDASGYQPSNATSFSVTNAFKSNAFAAANTLDGLKKRKLSGDFGPSAMTSQAFAKRRIVDPQ
ncbi:MAG: hypothetical protein Q9216_000048 [Gyalolechia sp. 2 TL-2023]